MTGSSSFDMIYALFSLGYLFPISAISNDGNFSASASPNCAFAPTISPFFARCFGARRTFHYHDDAYDAIYWPLCYMMNAAADTIYFSERQFHASRRQRDIRRYRLFKIGLTEVALDDFCALNFDADADTLLICRTGGGHGVE